MFPSPGSHKCEESLISSMWFQANAVHNWEMTDQYSLSFINFHQGV